MNIFNKTKLFIKKIIGKKIISFVNLVQDSFIDFLKYVKYSGVFKKNSINKIEASIILDYHSLEKGMLHKEIRFKFGKLKIVNLLRLLKKNEIIHNIKNSQLNAAAASLRNYFDIHVKNNIDISEFFTNEDYEFLLENYQTACSSVVSFKKDDFFNENKSGFMSFSNSRKSVREYTGEKVPVEHINKAIDIAKNAPSVCNRQPNQVFLIENKTKVDKILKVQGGLTGYTDKIVQLLVLVGDRNYFYTSGERNQLFIDGGIFLMNLLYALHYYKIAACPAHWALNNSHNKRIKKIIGLSNSQQVISLIAIGYPSEDFKTCKSKRRENNEVLKVIV
jgi:nitroreductase